MNTHSTIESRLGIITGTPGVRLPNGRIAINHSIARLLAAFREQFPGTRLCLPLLPQRHANMNFELNWPAADVTVLPPLKNFITAQRYYFQVRRIVRQFAATVDRLFIRLPFQIPGALLKLNTPKLLHFVGNARAIVAVSSDYHGPKKWLANRFASYTETCLRRMVAEPNTRCATNGSELWRVLGCRRGRVVVSSCLYEREMQPRASLTLNDPPRLLFVGYLRPEKGVPTLLDAFDRLRAKRPLQLTLVGGSDRVTNTGDLIQCRIDSSPFRSDIQQLGMLDFGPELFDAFRTHDIYVLPSLSEGTPRTLIEARAFGCPVVASRVGGIPDSVTDGKDGLLFAPGDAAELARQIERLLDDEALRIRLRQAGLEQSRQHTLESFAQELFDELGELPLPSRVE